MSTPTPGPWKGQQHGDDYIMKGANGDRVFSIRNGVIPMNEDARLIAAAPRMLAELKHHVCGLWCEHERCAVIRAILRDVEGESND